MVSLANEEVTIPILIGLILIMLLVVIPAILILLLVVVVSIIPLCAWNLSHYLFQRGLKWCR